MPFDPDAPFDFLDVESPDAAPAPDATALPMRVTSYGYGGDRYGDSASLGRGRFRVPTGAFDNPLRDTSFAASPDVEANIRAQGVQPMQPVRITFDDGTTETRTWDDRTAQDAQILAGRIPGVTKPLRGRVDFFSPAGVHPLDGRSITRIEPATAQPAASGLDPSQPYQLADSSPFDPGQPFKVLNETIGDEKGSGTAQPPVDDSTISAAPTFLSEAGKGNLRSAASIAYEDLRRPFSGLIGPTAQERSEGMIPFGHNPDGSIKYEYRPLGDRLTREAGLLTPFVPVPHLEASPEDSSLASVGKGAFNVGAGVAGGFMSPLGVILPGAGEVPAISRAGAGLFGADMLASAPGQVEQAINAPNLQGKVEGGLGAATSLVFAGAGGAHALRRGEPLPATPREPLSTLAAPAQEPASPPTPAPAAGGETPPPAPEAPFTEEGAKNWFGQQPQGGSEYSTDLAPQRVTGIFYERVRAAGKTKPQDALFEKALTDPNAEIGPELLKSIAEDAASRGIDLSDVLQKKTTARTVEGSELPGDETPTPFASQVGQKWEEGLGGADLLGELHKDPLVKLMLREAYRTGNANPNLASYKPLAEAGLVDQFGALTDKGREVYAKSEGFSGASDFEAQMQDWVKNRKPADDKLTGTAFRVGDRINLEGNAFPGGAVIEGQQADGNIIVNHNGKRWLTHPDALIAEGHTRTALNGEASPPNGPAAKPPVQPEAPVTPTPIKNAATDVDRVAQALQPRETPEPVNFAQAKDEAARIWQEDHGQVEALVSSLQGNQRRVTPVESFLLAHEWSASKGRLESIDSAIIKAHEAGEDVGPLMKQRAEIYDRHQKLADLLARNGTAWGREGRARQEFIAQDWSEPRLIQNLRGELGGRELEPNEMAEVRRRAALIETLSKGSEKDRAEAAQENARVTADETIPELAKENAREEAKPAAPGGVSKAQKVVEYLSKRAEEARARLKAKRENPGALSGPGDITDLDDYAIIAAAHIAKGVVKVADITAKMAGEFGDWIKPHIPAIMEAARKAKTEAIKTAGRLSPAQVGEKLKARLAEGHGIADLQPYVRRMARELVRGGITEREPLTDAVHGLMQEIIPGISREDAQNLWSGYGFAKEATKDVASKRLIELSGEQQQIGKLLDMSRGEPPRRTGQTRVPPTDENRRLTKLVNEQKKKGGFTTTDPATQLKSALDAIETRVKNQLRDAHTELDLGEQPPQRGPSPTNEKIEGLKALLDNVRETLKSVREKPEMTDEARIARVEQGLARENSRLEREIESEMATARQKPTSYPWSEKIAAMKARQAVLRAERFELSALKEAVTGDKRTKTAEARIAQLDRILKGEEPPKAKSDLTVPPKLEALQAERDAMQRQVNDLRAAAKRKTPDQVEAGKIKKAEEALAALDAKLKAGDLSTKARTPQPMSPERERVMAERQAMQRLLDEMRRDAVRVPEAVRILAARKKHVAAEIDKYREANLKRAEVPKRTPRPVPRDTALSRSESELAAEKLDYKRWVEKKRREEAPKWEKALNFYAGPLARNLGALSGVPVLAKLTVIAAKTAAIVRPAERLIQYGLSKAFSRAANRAPIEGVLSLKEYTAAEVGAAKATFRNLWRDFTGSADTSARAKPLKLGTTDFDLRYGKEKVRPDHWSDFTGAVHKALKTPVRRNEFERSMISQMAAARRQGMTEAEIADPLTQSAFGVRAYERANRAVFQNESGLVKAYKVGLAKLQRGGAGDKVAAALIRGELPVVSIPYNFVKTVLTEYIGGLYTVPELAIRYAKGIDKLTPDQGDRIFRTMARGAIGTGMIGLGFYLPQVIGGYYRKDAKRGKDEPDFNEARIGGVRIPRAVLHTPPDEAMQIGATARKVYDERMKKEGKAGAAADAAFTSAWGLTEEVPFVGQAVRNFRATEKGGGDAVGQFMASKLEPQAVQYSARLSDMRPGEKTMLDYLQPKAVRRTPKGNFFDKVGQNLELGIPGLRKRVPESKKQ